LDTYNKNTEEAVAMSVFGSSTYVIDDDMFYGQDSLGLVEYALHQTFQKTISR
jgi:2-hydroxychromene-2-carboxylate isomerase